VPTGWVYPMFGNQAGHHEFSSGYESPRGRCSMMRSNEGYKMRDVLCTDSYEAVCRYNVRDRGELGVIYLFCYIS